MISRDLETQWQKLNHSISVELHKFPKFGREHERRWVPKIYKSEIAIWMHFAIKHSCNLTGVFFFIYSQCVARCNGICQAQIDILKQLRGRRSVLIKF